MPTRPDRGGDQARLPSPANNLAWRTPRPCWCPTLLQDDEVEDPLLEEFKALRRKLSSWQSEGRCRRARRCRRHWLLPV